MLISGVIFVVWVFYSLVSVALSDFLDSVVVVVVCCLVVNFSRILIGVATGGLLGKMCLGYWELTFKNGV